MGFVCLVCDLFDSSSESGRAFLAVFFIHAIFYDRNKENSVYNYARVIARLKIITVLYHIYPDIREKGQTFTWSPNQTAFEAGTTFFAVVENSLI